MSTTAPVNPDDLGRGPMIVGLTWTFTSLCILVVAARFYVRKRLVASHSVAVEDWLMLVAVILQVAFQCIITECYRSGLGKHDVDLTMPQLFNVLKWNWISTTPAILVSIVARISITILLIKLFGLRIWFKWFLIIFTSLQSIVATLAIIFVWVQVSPVQALWDPEIAVSYRWDSRIQQDTTYLGQSLFTFSDFSYVLFPVLIVWKLNMPMRRKIAVILLMALSLFTMSASIMKTVTAQSSQTDTDVEYNASMAILWSGIEQSFVIIMGCIPSLRPIFNQQSPFKFRSLGSLLSSFPGIRTESSRLKASVGDYAAEVELGVVSTHELHLSDKRSIEPSPRGSSQSVAEFA